MNIHNEVRVNIEGIKAQSAWARGVKATALELLEDTDHYGLPISEENLLNGADDWQHYSEGGCSLIYDYDIAERYCTPSELKRCKGGERMPNAQENWIELQARALYQASRLIITTEEG